MLSLLLCAATVPEFEYSMSLFSVIVNGKQLNGTHVITSGYLVVPTEGAYDPSLFVDHVSADHGLRQNSVSVRMSEKLEIDGKQVKSSANRTIYQTLNRKYVTVKGVIRATVLFDKSWGERVAIYDVNSISTVRVIYKDPVENAAKNKPAARDQK